jgi:hypothetical protein
MACINIYQAHKKHQAYKKMEAEKELNESTHLRTSFYNEKEKAFRFLAFLATLAH